MGATIDHAIFVPPSPLQLNDHLCMWEKYLEMDDCDHLLQMAVVHAQFELLHPFKDGNGRIGRILIPLFLYRKKKLSHPMFYLSSYLEKNRDIYYARLKGISLKCDWDSWVEFFLQAIAEQARENSTKVKNIMALYEKMKIHIYELTHSSYSIQIIDTLFDRPIFQTADFVKRSGIPKQTAMPFLRRLRDENILTTLREASGRRAAILAFTELLNIAEGKELF